MPPPQQEESEEGEDSLPDSQQESGAEHSWPEEEEEDEKPSFYQPDEARPSEPSVCRTRREPSDQGETELVVLEELWTINHTDPHGNPCDGCPTCTKSEALGRQVNTFRARATEYQYLEAQLEHETNRIQTELNRREEEWARARAPLDNELTVENRGRDREARRLERVWAERKKAIKDTYEKECKELQKATDQQLAQARREYEEGFRDLYKDNQSKLRELNHRLSQLKEEQGRSRESFQAAAKTELEILRRRVTSVHRQYDYARSLARQLCPHPSLETLPEILARWPTREGKPAPGILRCRVCHRTWTHEDLVDNVCRGATTLIYNQGVSGGLHLVTNTTTTVGEQGTYTLGQFTTGRSTGD